MAFGVFLRLEKGELKMTYDEFLDMIKDRWTIRYFQILEREKV